MSVVVFWWSLDRRALHGSPGGCDEHPRRTWWLTAAVTRKESHRERARAELGTYTAAALRAGSLLLSLVLIEQGIAGDSACRAITCGGQSAMVG